MNRILLSVSKKHIRNIRQYLGLNAGISIDDEFVRRVSEFQRDNNLPITGAVDFVTYEKMKKAYRHRKVFRGDQTLGKIDFPLSRGSRGKHVLRLNGMLKGMLLQYDDSEILPGGELFDEKTSNAVIKARRIFGFAGGEDVDLEFYLRLAREIITDGSD